MIKLDVVWSGFRLRFVFVVRQQQAAKMNRVIYYTENCELPRQMNLYGKRAVTRE